VLSIGRALLSITTAVLSITNNTPPVLTPPLVNSRRPLTPWPAAAPALPAVEWPLLRESGHSRPQADRDSAALRAAEPPVSPPANGRFPGSRARSRPLRPGPPPRAAPPAGAASDRGAGVRASGRPPARALGAPLGTSPRASSAPAGPQRGRPPASAPAEHGNRVGERRFAARSGAPPGGRPRCEQAASTGAAAPAAAPRARPRAPGGAGPRSTSVSAPVCLPGPHIDGANFGKSTPRRRRDAGHGGQHGSRWSARDSRVRLMCVYICVVAMLRCRAKSWTARISLVAS
jgi:hypothetical protein